MLTKSSVQLRCVDSTCYCRSTLLAAKTCRGHKYSVSVETDTDKSFCRELRAPVTRWNSEREGRMTVGESVRSIVYFSDWLVVAENGVRKWPSRDWRRQWRRDDVYCQWTDVTVTSYQLRRKQQRWTHWRRRTVTITSDICFSGSLSSRSSRRYRKLVYDCTALPSICSGRSSRKMYSHRRKCAR